MKYILVANEDSNKTFFPLREVFFFASLISLILYFLFPQNLLQKVLAQNKSAAVTLSYLKAFKKEYQQDPQFMFALIEQEIGMGQLPQAKSDLQQFQAMTAADPAQQKEHLLWLNYLLLRTKTYDAKMNTEKRIAYMHQLRDMLSHLSQASLQPYQLKAMAQDSLWLGQGSVALSIYKGLRARNELPTAEDLATGGDIAMQNNDHKESSQFYWAAYQKATNPKNQKSYALNAIKALWAGNYVNEAIALADKLPNALIHDRETLLYLSHLALAANQPKIAEKYALQALLLNTGHQHE